MSLSCVSSEHEAKPQQIQAQPNSKKETEMRNCCVLNYFRNETNILQHKPPVAPSFHDLWLVACWVFLCVSQHNVFEQQKQSCDITHSQEILLQVNNFKSLRAMFIFYWSFFHSEFPFLSCYKKWIRAALAEIPRVLWTTELNLKSLLASLSLEMPLTESVKWSPQRPLKQNWVNTVIETEIKVGKQTDKGVKCNCMLKLLACWEKAEDQFAA